jgi:YD repeat-containing protein
MELLRALLRNRRSFGRNRGSSNGGRDPRRRFVRENRITFEQLEAKVVLANMSANGAFSVLLDNAPGDVNGFDGNLALYQSGLVYNSKTVSDAVIQFAGELEGVGGYKPDKVSAVFTFNEGSPQTYYWEVDAGANIGDEMIFRILAPNDPLPTGTYDWDVDLTFHQGSNTYSPSVSPDYDGNFSYVDRSASEFGKGWYHEDLAVLKLENDGFLLITGWGEPTWFAWNGTAYVREPGDQLFYTVTGNQTSTYLTLTDKFGSSMKFLRDAPTDWGRLEASFDASDNEQRFEYYDTGDNVGKLKSITYIPTGDTTAFAYSGGFLTTITETIGAVAGVGGKWRAASVSITSGQLDSITLPDPDDGSALVSPVWGFEYSDTTGLITKTTDPVGSTSEFTYGTDGANETIASIKQGADTSYLTPYNSAKLGDVETSPGTLKAVEDTFGQFTDERAKITKFEANALGHITKITDDDGNATTFERDANEGWLTKITTPDPDGGASLQALEITYTYSDDGRGNRESETKRAVGSATILAQQSWKYENADYSVPTEHTDELGRATKYVIGPKGGDTDERGKILSMTQIIGIEDNPNATETDDATTSFTYTTVAGHVGLLDSITDPLGRVTKHEYWTTNPHEGLLKRVTRNYGAQLTNNVQYEYDDFRNREAVIDELGRRTEFTFDKLDRLIQRTDADPDGTGGSQYTSPIPNSATTPPATWVTRPIP